MSKINLQEFWEDHSIVTDEMVIELKDELKMKTMKRFLRSLFQMDLWLG
jgi:predicted transcriptional regulator